MQNLNVVKAEEKHKGIFSNLTINVQIKELSAKREIGPNSIRVLECLARGYGLYVGNKNP